MRRPRQDDEPLRVGKVLDRAGTTATVQWHDDGSIEENVRLDSRNLLAPEGSLRHLYLVDSAELQRRFTADPMGIVIHLLRERPKGLKGTDIKSTLVGFGLEKATVDKKWKVLQPQLTGRDDVTFNSNVYMWKPSGKAPEPDEPLSLPDSGEQPRKRPSEPFATRSGKPFATRLSELLDAAQPRPVQDFLATPLRTGVLLGRLNHSAIDELLSELQETDRQAFSVMLLAVPGRAPGDPLSTEIYRDVLIAATAELRADPSPALRPAVVWLLRKVADSATLPAEAVEPFVQLALLLTQDPQKAELKALEAAACAISGALPATHHGLLRIAERLPFTPEGGRTKLTAAVGERWPTDVLDERWWAGMTVQDLVDCAQGRFGRLTRSPEVVEAIIRPLLERELAGATTRARLSLFLGMPSQYAELLPVPAVAEAFARVGQRDPLAASWIDALREQDRLDALKEDVRRAREEAAAAAERAEAAEERRRELADRLQRLEEDLRDLQGAEVTIRAAQERQIKIDVIRALADLAAEVEELTAAKAAPEILVERVRGLAATHSLRPIGNANGEVIFDLELHEPIYGAPEPGVPVLVIRPGYIWNELILQRALVDPKE